MSIAEPQLAVPKPNFRWFHPTADRLIVVLLAVEGLLFLSERFCWLPKGWPVLIAIAAVAVAMPLMLLWFAVALLFRRRFQYGLRTLLLATTALAGMMSLYAWQVARAARQRQCIEAIHARGGYVNYDYELANGQYNPQGKSPVPQWLHDRLGEDFFHRVASVHLVNLYPLGWEKREEERLAPFFSSREGLSAEDYATFALHELRACGGDQVDLYYNFALELDPHCTEANLILGARLLERYNELTKVRPYLEAVLADSLPESIEHAHAQKLLAGEKWTFDELCQRVGADGVLK